MKKRILLLLFILLIPICFAKGLQKTYTWEHFIRGFEANTYRVTLTTSDVWHVDTRIDITFRLALLMKSSSLNYTVTEEMRMALSSPKFSWDVGKYRDLKPLVAEGDFWEKRVSFSIDAENLDRGQTVSVSVTFELIYNEIDNIEGKQMHSYETTIYDNPMLVNLNRPFLSTLETAVVASVLIVTFVGTSIVVFYRRKRTTQEMKGRRRLIR
ncbi:MAG: hypothetical protein PVF15_06545 [Candidatus Bathyarchaeota archaeon]|jgi:hypothetical protein